MTEDIAPNYNYDDPDRFRLSDEQWLTLCCEFNLSHNEGEANNAKIFDTHLNWEEIADWNRAILEDACAAFFDQLGSPAQQRKAFEYFAEAATALVESYEKIIDDLPLNEPDNICEDVIGGVRRVRDRAKSAAAEIVRQNQRIRSS